MAETKRFVALDVQFLLGLGDGHPVYTEAYDWLNQNRFFFLTTPTVDRLLVDLAENGSDDVKSIAYFTLSQLTNFGVLQPPNPHVAMKLQYPLAARLLERGVLANATVTDAIVLVEAALYEVSFLITDRTSLLNSDPTKLSVDLLANDLKQVIAASAQEINEAFREHDVRSRAVQESSRKTQSSSAEQF